MTLCKHLSSETTIIFSDITRPPSTLITAAQAQEAAAPGPAGLWHQPSPRVSLATIPAESAILPQRLCRRDKPASLATPANRAAPRIPPPPYQLLLKRPALLRPGLRQDISEATVVPKCPRAGSGFCSFRRIRNTRTTSPFTGLPRPE